MSFWDLLFSRPSDTNDRCREQPGRVDTKNTDAWKLVRPSRELENQLFAGKDAAGFSGQSRRLALPPSTVLGQGYSTISNSLRGIGMETEAQTNEKPIGGVTYDLKLIRSHEELATSLSISASASISGAWGGASASYNMFRSTDFHSERSYVLLTMTAIASEQHLAAYKLTSRALARMNQDSRSFYSTYGDSFVGHVVRGAQLLALMEFSSEIAEERLSVATSLSANFSAGGASFSQVMSEASKNKRLNVRVIYAQTGGGVGRALGYDTGASPGSGYATKGGVLTLSPDELLGRIREFPHEVRSDDGKEWSTVLWGYASDYSAADNVPMRPTLAIPFLSAGWTLDDLGSEKLAVDTRRNDLKGMLQDPSQLDRRDELERVSEHLGYVSREIDRVGQVVVAFPLTSSRVQNGDYNVTCWQSAEAQEAPSICPIGQGNTGALLDKVLARALVLPKAMTTVLYGKPHRRQAQIKTHLGTERDGLWRGLRFTFDGDPNAVKRVQFRGWLHNFHADNGGSSNLDWVALVNDGQLVPPIHGQNNAYDWSWGKDPEPLLEVPKSLFQTGFTIEILMIADQIGDVDYANSVLEVFVSAVS